MEMFIYQERAKLNKGKAHKIVLMLYVKQSTRQAICTLRSIFNRQRENSGFYAHSLSNLLTTDEMVAKCILSANHDWFRDDGNSTRGEERKWLFILVILFGKKGTGTTPVV